MRTSAVAVVLPEKGQQGREIVEVEHDRVAIDRDGDTIVDCARAQLSVLRRCSRVAGIEAAKPVEGLAPHGDVVGSEEPRRRAVLVVVDKEADKGLLARLAEKTFTVGSPLPTAPATRLRRVGLERSQHWGEQAGAQDDSRHR